MSTPHTTGQAPSAQHREIAAADVGTVVNRHGIRTVEPLIRPYVRHTPAITVDRADFGLPPGPLVLKLEQLQHGGSFKARGAFANVLLRDMPAAGVRLVHAQFDLDFARFKKMFVDLMTAR